MTKVNNEIVTMTLETEIPCMGGYATVEAILHVAVTGYDAEDRTVDYFIDKVTTLSGIEVHESWGDLFTDEEIEEELWSQFDEAHEEAALEAAIDRYESDQFYLVYCIY